MSLAFLKQLIVPKRKEQGLLRGSIRSYGTRNDDESHDVSFEEARSKATVTPSDIESQDHGYDQESYGNGRWTPNPRMISDAIIGLSDGLTVPFALTAGLSSLDDTRIVVLGGLAELMAGAISMGLGGFIGAKSEAESYQAKLAEAKKLIRTSPFRTSAHVLSVFRPYDLPVDSLKSIERSLQQSPTELLDFLMRFYYETPQPSGSRPFVSAATIASGYFIGGFIPLLPYFFVGRGDVLQALWWSVGIMIFALFVFGWVKTSIVCGWRGKSNVIAGFKGGAQMVVVGGIAAGAAIGLVRAINHT